MYAKNAIYYLMVTAITTVVSFVISPFMALNLSPTDYSIIGYYNSFNYLIAPLLSFTFVTYYSRNYYRMNDEKREIVLDNMLIALLIWGGVGIPLIGSIFLFYFYYTNVNLPIYPFFIYVLFSTYFNNFLTFIQITYRMKRKAKDYFKITVLSLLLSSLLSTILVVGFKFGANGSLIAPLISSIIFTVYCFKKFYKGSKFDKKILKDALKFGWPITLSSMLWYFFAGFDKALLEKLNDNTNFALFNIAASISGVFMVLGKVSIQTFEPDIFESITQNNKKKLLSILFGIVLIVAIPCLLFIPFSEIIVKIVTANKYTEAYLYSDILVFKNITLILYSLSVSVLIGYGFTKSLLKIHVACAIISVIIFNIMIDNFHFIGAAWAQVLIFLILFIISILFIITKTNNINK